MDDNTPITVIEDRLFFTLFDSQPADSKSKHYFSVDDALVYRPFFADFGPLNLAHLYRFCKALTAKLECKALKKKKIYYFCRNDFRNISNAAFLIGSYQVICLNKTAEEAYECLRHMKFEAFRDASMGICDYALTVKTSIEAVEKAMSAGFLDFSNFNLQEYELYEQVEYGDFNLIVPDKFLAFCGPSNTTIDSDGYPALTPAYYYPLFRKFNVSTIVRLNRRCYDRRRFERQGFEHHDLIYPDGTIPPEHVLQKFLEICENAEGLVAVHCKAGLGRTGTCIGAYIMKHYRWTAAHAIAWMRICRPGSVIGPQQQYLERQQERMWALAENDKTESSECLPQSKPGEQTRSRSRAPCTASIDPKTSTGPKYRTSSKRRLSQGRALLNAKLKVREAQIEKMVKRFDASAGSDANTPLTGRRKRLI